ncbi:hypothetical protein [Lysinibacillus sp. SGAir0095]|uniref:hypothetical protein n=1 Tax=Lysinibacillus sp. SGAir0095 TaxID=2070463 RepID=UPI0010CCC77F|nr:hypothetical protein [Lysinibacillus sp. SGAir0095]QCR33108.1 hypothetical protein C1N55_13370 [Lysinibacillus sp. SGAir0095]
MIFEELQENYTKVSYRKPLIIESKKELETVIKKSDLSKKLIKIVIAGTIFYFTMDSSVFAAGGLDARAEKFYFDTFIGIAKWIVIIKGAWDIVGRSMKEDFEGAKRGLLQYVLIFGVLMGLPWAMNEIESIFREEL